MLAVMNEKTRKKAVSFFSDLIYTVIYTQPVIIQRPAVVVQQPRPIYLKVPPGHERNWTKHCHQYDACGMPVYFVKYDDNRHDWDDHHDHHDSHDHHHHPDHDDDHDRRHRHHD